VLWVLFLADEIRDIPAAAWTDSWREWVNRAAFKCGESRKRGAVSRAAAPEAWNPCGFPLVKPDYRELASGEAGCNMVDRRHPPSVRKWERWYNRNGKIFFSLPAIWYYCLWSVCNCLQPFVCADEGGTQNKTLFSI